METINDLQFNAWKIADDHGFHQAGVSPGDRIALMHSELSEALEEIRSGRQPNETYYSEGDQRETRKPEGFGVELADCVIRIMDACEIYGINLEALLVEKMKYNATREHMHGKTI